MITIEVHVHVHVGFGVKMDEGTYKNGIEIHVILCYRGREPFK